MVIKAYAPLSSRIAEEMQLLAEEKWIIEALTQVRKERNAMQIERLEMESAKVLLLRYIRSGPKSTTTPPTQNEPSPLPQSASVEGSAVEMMITSQSGATLADLEDALPQDLEDDAFCNDQQLNLTVTDSIFGMDVNEIEVEEEESDGSEEESPDSIFMDMNMFMNSDKRW